MPEVRAVATRAAAFFSAVASAAAQLVLPFVAAKVRPECKTSLPVARQLVKRGEVIGRGCIAVGDGNCNT